MAPPKKCLRAVKTMARLVDGRRSRTSAGALMEMAALANERARLQKELEAARRRREQIEARLREIAAKEQRLQAFISTPLGATPLADELPVELPLNMKSREFRY